MKIISYVLIELTWIDCIPAFFSIIFSSSISWYPRHVDVGTRVIRCGREFRSSAQYEHWELSTPLKLTLKLATVKWVKCQTPKPPESCRLCHKELVTTLSESPNLLSSSGALASSSLPNHHRHLKWIQVTRAVAGQNPATNRWQTEPSRWSWIEGSTHCPLDMAGHQGSGTTARPNNYSFWEASTVEKQMFFDIPTEVELKRLYRSEGMVDSNVFPQAARLDTMSILWTPEVRWKAPHMPHSLKRS